LWTNAQSFIQDKNDYKEGSFLALKYKDIEKKMIQGYLRDTNLLIKGFNGMPNQEIGKNSYYFTFF